MSMSDFGKAVTAPSFLWTVMMGLLIAGGMYGTFSGRLTALEAGIERAMRAIAEEKSEAQKRIDALTVRMDRIEEKTSQVAERLGRIEEKQNLMLQILQRNPQPR
jgi:hypothetical protein